MATTETTRVEELLAEATRARDEIDHAVARLGSVIRELAGLEEPSTIDA